MASPATKDLTKEATADENLIVENEQVTLIVDDRRYRVRGLDKNTNAWTLKVNIMASRDDLVHLDTLDLVKARSRASFIKAAASELFVDADLIKRDIGKLLLKLKIENEVRCQLLRAKPPVLRQIKQVIRMLSSHFPSTFHPTGGQKPRDSRSRSQFC